MVPSNQNKLTDSVQNLKQSNSSLLQSANILRKIGYVFLLLSFVDLITMLYPPRFFNPTWELQLLGQVVEKVVVPLLGFALVFFCGEQARSKWEFPVLKFLSWTALIYGLVLILFIPLGIFNTVRIDRQNQKNIALQVEQQVQVIQNASSQIGSVNDTQQMQALLSRINRQGQVPEIKDSQQLEEVKKQVLSSIDIEATNIKARGAESLSNLRFSLLKNSVKWNLGALVAGILLIFISKSTRTKSS